jgi:ribokinase
MRVLCIGSLNIDHVYRVDHLVRPGETIASTGHTLAEARAPGGAG